MLKLQSGSRWVLILVVTALSWGCGGAKQRKAVHMEKGLALLKEGNLDKARLEFSNVLQIDPKDVEAHYQLGEVFERKRSYRDAMGQYLAVIQLDETNLKAHLKAGQIFMVAEAYDQAKEQIDQVLRIAPDNPDGLALRGALRARKNDIKGSEEDADRLLAMDAGNISAIALKSGILNKRGANADAIALVEGGIKRQPTDVTLRYLLAELLGNQSVGRVTDILNEIIKLEPDELKHRLELSTFLARNNKVDAAEQVLRTAISHPPIAADAKLALVDFLIRERKPERAEPELQALIQQDPDASALRFGLARLYEISQKSVQAIQVYRDLIQRYELSPPGLEARTKLAALLSADQNYTEARPLIQEVLKENPKDQAALLVGGKLALLEGDAQTAISRFRTALRDSPNAVELLRGLARAHLLNKEPQLAEDAWKQAIGADPKAISAYLDLAKHLVNTQRIDAAIEKVQDALRAVPNDLGALTALFQLQVGKNDLTGAQATADIILKKYPNLPSGYQMSGIVRSAQKDYAGSVADFESALGKAPTAIDPLAQIINSWLAQGKPEKALERLDQILQEAPKNFFALNMKGEVQLSQNKYDAAVATFKRAIEVNSKWAVPYRGVALALLAKGDKDGAIKTLKGGLEATNKSPALVSDLAQLFDRFGRIDDAIALYEDVLKDDPRSEMAANNLAMLLVDHRTDAASLERASAMAAILSANRSPAYLDTIGWVQFKRHELEQAIPNLVSAVAAAPNSGVIHYHLGMAYASHGDRTQAAEQLEMAIASKEDFAERAASEKALAELRSQAGP